MCCITMVTLCILRCPQQALTVFIKNSLEAERRSPNALTSVFLWLFSWMFADFHNNIEIRLFQAPDTRSTTMNVLPEDHPFSSSCESDSDSGSGCSNSASDSERKGGTWAAEALLLQQVNWLRQHNKEALKLKRKAFDAWKITARVHLRQLQREAAQLLLLKLRQALCRRYFGIWKGRCERYPKGRSSIEEAWNVAAQEELLRTREQLAALTLQAEKAALTSRAQAQSLQNLRAYVYRLELQRYLLSIIVFIIGKPRVNLRYLRKSLTSGYYSPFYGFRVGQPLYRPSRLGSYDVALRPLAGFSCVPFCGRCICASQDKGIYRHPSPN